MRDLIQALSHSLPRGCAIGKSYYRWRQFYVSMEADLAKRLKQSDPASV
jgi:hypothetical protein